MHSIGSGAGQAAVTDDSCGIGNCSSRQADLSAGVSHGIGEGGPPSFTSASIMAAAASSGSPAGVAGSQPWHVDRTGLVFVMIRGSSAAGHQRRVESSATARPTSRGGAALTRLSGAVPVRPPERGCVLFPETICSGHDAGHRPRCSCENRCRRRWGHTAAVAVLHGALRHRAAVDDGLPRRQVSRAKKGASAAQPLLASQVPPTIAV